MLRSKTTLMVSALAIALAGPMSATFSEEAPLPPPRPADLAPSATPSPAASPPSLKSPEKADQTCLTKLIASGAGAEAASLQEPIAEGCGISSPVRLHSIALANGDVVGLPDGPILECEFALVFADYVRVIVAPLGAGTLGTKVEFDRDRPRLSMSQSESPSGRQDQRPRQRDRDRYCRDTICGQAARRVGAPGWRE